MASGSWCLSPMAKVSSPRHGVQEAERGIACFYGAFLFLPSVLSGIPGSGVVLATGREAFCSHLAHSGNAQGCTFLATLSTQPGHCVTNHHKDAIP